MAIALAEIDSWRLMFDDLARAIAYYLIKTTALENNLDITISSTDTATTVDLIPSVNNLFNANSDSVRQSQLNAVTTKFLNHIKVRLAGQDLTNPFPTVSSFLIDNNLKVSQLIFDVQQNNNILTNENFATEGSWSFEFPLKNDAGTSTFYNFAIQISDTQDFSNIIFDIDSTNSITGWLFESDPNVFTNLEPGGVSSDLVGRRIRYVSQSNQLLTRTQVIYLRVRQHAGATYYNYRNFQDIIFT